MPEENTDYPPQFASSDLSSLLGQINDFAGVEPPPPPPPGEGVSPKSVRSNKVSASLPEISDSIAKRIAAGDYVFPVNIIGSSAQRGPYLPGLKDILIATSMLRLAEQITVSEMKASAQKQAYTLMQAAHARLGEHIAKQLRSVKK